MEMTDGPTGAGDQIVPDTRDWTWRLERPCPACGPHDLAHHLRDVGVPVP